MNTLNQIELLTKIAHEIHDKGGKLFYVGRICKR